MNAGPILVCGLGSIGYRIVELLWRLGEPARVVTAEAREERVRETEAHGVTVVRGDARDPALLGRAGIAKARALIATTSQDLVNVEIALDARRARPDLPIVIRLFDQELARKLEAGFGIRRALGVSALAAPTFAAAALGERWIGSFRLGGEVYVIGRLAVSEGSPLASRTVADLARERLAVAAVEDESGAAPEGALRPGARVTLVGPRPSWGRLMGTAPGAEAARRSPPWQRLDPRPGMAFARQVWKNAPAPLRSAFLALLGLIAVSVVVFRFAMSLTLVDAFYFIISTVTTTGYGDITPRGAPAAVKLYACLVMVLGSAATAVLYSIITDFLVTARFAQVLGRERIPREGHVVVVGLGNVGFRVVEELRQAGAEVAVIDREGEGEFVEAVRSHTPVVRGDARLPAILARAGLDRASALVCVTGDDAVNLGVALSARERRGDLRTIVRLFDPDFARKAQAAFRLDAAMSASLQAAPQFVASALYPDVRAAFVDAERRFVVLREVLAAEWEGLTPSRLRRDRGATVLMRRRIGRAAYAVASGEAPLAADEEVLALLSRPLAEDR